MDTIPPYSLDTRSGRDRRHVCPSCGHRGVFKRYVDNSTGEYLGYHVGRCNREFSCGYHYPPRQFFEDNGIKHEPSEWSIVRPPVVVPYGEIETSVMEATLSYYEMNGLYLYLNRKFDDQLLVVDALKKYNVGTSRLFNGGTVYWRVDTGGSVRSGQIMAYDPVTGKRRKECNTWVHSTMKLGDFRLKRVLFGEHLLNDRPNDRVAVVESQKSAIICSIVYPRLVWVATCGKGNLNRSACSELAGRDVVIIPDTDAHDDWIERSVELESLCFRIEVSNDLMEVATPENIEAGDDIVDFLEEDKNGKFVIKNQD